jgi:hypothetical protein
MAVTGTLNSQLQSVHTPTAGTVPSHLSTRSLLFPIPRVSHSNRRIDGAGTALESVSAPRLAWTPAWECGNDEDWQKTFADRGRYGQNALADLALCALAHVSKSARRGAPGFFKSPLTRRKPRRTVLLPPDVGPRSPPQGNRFASQNQGCDRAFFC